MVLVDGLEIGEFEGMVCLRAGNSAGKLVFQAVIPANVAARAIDSLKQAALHAEEDYWRVLADHQREGITDDEFTQSLEKWVLSRDWDQLLKRVPRGLEIGDQLALATGWGHVVMIAPPVFIDREVVALLCPLQIHRLMPSLKSAEARAAANAEGLTEQWSTEQGRAVALWRAQMFLQSLPWSTNHEGFPPPTQAEAEDSMKRQYTNFLAREPYQLPDENRLPE